MKQTTQILFTTGVIALASLLLLAFAPLTQPATAQRAEQKQLYNISISRFKPEMETEYYDFIKNVMNPLYVKGGVKLRLAYRPDRGTRNEIVYFALQDNYASIGAQPGVINKALGNEDAVRLFWQRHSRFIEGSELLTVEAQPDLSWTNPKFQGQPQLAILRWQRAAPGRTGEYESWLKSYLKSVSQSAMLGQWRFRLRFGGDTTTYLMLRPLASTAELDAGDPLVNKLGETEARKIYNQLVPGVITQDEAWLIRFRPDLSIIDGKLAPTP